MEISRGNTLENSGKQNPKMGFKSPPEQIIRIHATFKWLKFTYLRHKSFYVENVIPMGQLWFVTLTPPRIRRVCSFLCSLGMTEIGEVSARKRRSREEIKRPGWGPVGQRILDSKTQLKILYVDWLQLTTILFPLDSVVFYPEGISQGNTMENSGK